MIMLRKNIIKQGELAFFLSSEMKGTVAVFFAFLPSTLLLVIITLSAPSLDSL